MLGTPGGCGPLARPATRFALLLLLGACGGGGDAGTGGPTGPSTPTSPVAPTPPTTPPPPVPGTLALAAGAAATSVNAGGTLAIPLTITRGGSFAGAVALSVENAPAGVTATFAPATLDAATTSATLTLTVASDAAVGAATLTVRARGAGVGDATMGMPLTIDPPLPGTVLRSGVALAGLAGAEGSQRLFRITVPAGATRLEVRTADGSGDVDLYVRRGQPATPGAYDCASEDEATVEGCVIASPMAGEWYVLLVGFDVYAGVTLTPMVTMPTRR